MKLYTWCNALGFHLILRLVHAASSASLYVSVSEIMAFNVLLRETTLVVGNGDTIRLAGHLVRGRECVGVDVERNLDLRYATRSRGDSRGVRTC